MSSLSTPAMYREELQEKLTSRPSRPWLLPWMCFLFRKPTLVGTFLISSSVFVGAERQREFDLVFPFFCKRNSLQCVSFWIFVSLSFFYYPFASASHTNRPTYNFNIICKHFQPFINFSHISITREPDYLCSCWGQKQLFFIFWIHCWNCHRCWSCDHHRCRHYHDLDIPKEKSSRGCQDAVCGEVGEIFRLWPQVLTKMKQEWTNCNQQSP